MRAGNLSYNDEIYPKESAYYIDYYALTFFEVLSLHDGTDSLSSLTVLADNLSCIFGSNGQLENNSVSALCLLYVYLIGIADKFPGDINQ